MQTRIYRPLTVEDLRGLERDGVLAEVPSTAYAVTTDLRREHPGADEEELEYLAFTDAARSGGSVRVLAAADVDEGSVAELLDASRPVSAVRLTAPVPRRQVVSFHLADPSDPSDPSDPGATADGDEPGLPAYSWYDATELDVVLDLLA